MNTDEINDQVLEHLADMHRTRFFTLALSYRIGDASLDELILYGYGVIAGSDEAEERREGGEVRPREGYLDCETSPHFWRGVCEARRAEIGMPLNRKPRKKTDEEGRRYARFKVRGPGAAPDQEGQDDLLRRRRPRRLDGGRRAGEGGVRPGGGLPHTRARRPQHNSNRMIYKERRSWPTGPSRNIPPTGTASSGAGG